MKTVPATNLKVTYVIVDRDLQEHESFPVGKYTLQQADAVLSTKDGNHELTLFYFVMP